MALRAPVLISGAGPSGLVLAIALRKNGIPTRIIDKELKPRLGERGAGISPRSIELHRILGTGPAILRAGASLPLSRHYDVDGITPIKTFQMVPAVEPTPNAPNSNALMLGQNHHEAILRAHLEELGTKVEFGSELTKFSQTSEGVKAEITHHQDGNTTTENIEVPWLVGSDGAHSFVRKSLGLEFLGETRVGQTMVLGDIKVKEGPREYWEQWGGPSATRIANLRPSGQDPDTVTFLFAGAGFEPEKIYSSREALVDLFYEISNRRDIKFGDLVWSAVYRPNIRMVNQMRVNRVFVLGDAAHCHTPAGGQGMNSGIQDSFNLGWKLALVYRGLAKPEFLDSFASERLPVIAEMLNKTTEMFGHVMKTAGGERGNRGGDFSQLGVNYRNSSIVLSDNTGSADAELIPSYNKESETAAQPGDRAPDAPSLINIADGSSTTLFGLLSPSLHTVLVFSNDRSVCQDVAEAIHRQPENTVRSVLILQPQPPQTENQVDEFLNYTVLDQEGHAYGGYRAIDRVGGVQVVIVRPDGVIGARLQDTEGIRRYFGKLFH
ncbi:monooxygenase [Panaeolus papilionaceus]|nr:monooxygenase [Panaeolus papilionaceus]